VDSSHQPHITPCQRQLLRPLPKSLSTRDHTAPMHPRCQPFPDSGSRLAVIVESWRWGDDLRRDCGNSQHRLGQSRVRVLRWQCRWPPRALWKLPPLCGLPGLGSQCLGISTAAKELPPAARALLHVSRWTLRRSHLPPSQTPGRHLRVTSPRGWWSPQRHSTCAAPFRSPYCTVLDHCESQLP
jgi:hypothetical protein